MFFSERVFLQITLWLIIAITPYQLHMYKSFNTCQVDAYTVHNFIKVSRVLDIIVFSH